MEVAIIRGSTKETRAAILKSAMEVFLEVGYQEASMRKIAARAGITAGAIYKHFSGKEEMFDEIFEESGRKLMEVTESMIGIDFTAMSDDELLNVLYSRVSVQIFDMLEGDMQLFHMLLKNDSGKCLEKFRSIYIEEVLALRLCIMTSYTNVGLQSGNYLRKQYICSLWLSSQWSVK